MPVEPGGTLIFKTGKFRGMQVDELQVYSDGFIVIGKNTTDYLSDFVDEINQTLEENFGILLAEYPAPIKIYESQIVVQLDQKFEDKFSILSDLYNSMDRLSAEYNLAGAGYRLGGFHVESESPAQDARKPPTFTLVRRAGVTFDAGYWYSSAGLKTADHLSVLADLEKRLLK